MSDPAKPIYALPDCRIQPIDDRAIVIVRLDNGAAALMDASWRHFLPHLRVFRTLEDHAAAIAQRFPELRGHEQGLLEGFRQLVPRGVLHSGEDVVRQFEAGRSYTSANTAPMTLCIRTCDRPESLRTLLESLRDNARQFKTRWPIELLDDSRENANREANQGLCRAFAAELALTYVGPDEQETLLAELCHQNPEDCADLRWLLDANHPDNQGQATHGRLYNLAIIRHAGQRILLIDDDVRLIAWQRPDVRPEPRFHLISLSGANFENAEKARAVLKPYAADPIAAHAETLGLPVADAIQRLTGEAPTPALFAGLPLDLVPHPYARLGRVRYTHNGFFGDTGSTSNHDRLWHLHTTMPAVLASPERYERFRAGPRFDFTGSDRPELINGTHFHHTTCAGLDLADLVPPVLPRGRSEDALLASLLRLLYPGDYGLCHPFALEHRVHGARPWIFAPEALQQPPDQSTAMGYWVNHLVASADIEPCQRLALLRQSLEVAHDTGLLTARLHNIIERQTNEDLAYQLSEVQRALGPTSSANDGSGEISLAADHPWKQDLQQVYQWVGQQLYDSGLHQPLYRDLPAVTAEMVRFAQTLPAWQRAFGTRLARLPA